MKKSDSADKLLELARKATARRAVRAERDGDGNIVLVGRHTGRRLATIEDSSMVDRKKSS